MKRPFHLAWFLSQGYGPKSWRGDWPGSRRWMMPDLFVDLARGMERACFDYIIIEDSSNVPYTYKGSHDTSCNMPRARPSSIPPCWCHLAQATKHLGLVPTLSVSEYPPYLLARLVNSLDHVTEGRIGWNCVTGSNDGAAQNYGRDKHLPHDERYDIADRFADIVTRLWEAWGPTPSCSTATSRCSPTAARSIHPPRGKYFRCRGPINAPRSPQGRVPICQAGGSPRGQRFASAGPTRSSPRAAAASTA
jgi:alkanesulfonate monooxygenase SsuD/methylene tetrahydromethanopterin reductase-like flavin-dependent oxidoreductase (luciferase family)